MLVLFSAIAIAGGVYVGWLVVRDPLMRRGIIRKPRPRRKQRKDFY
jgi:hypothetical protein